MSGSAPSEAAASHLHHRRGVTLMLASAACFTTNVLLIRLLGQLEAVSVWLVSGARFAVGMAVVFVLYRREFRASHLFTNRKLVARGD